MILMEEVEILRNMLYDVIKQKDEELILKLSKRLDEIIVRYYMENSDHKN